MKTNRHKKIKMKIDKLLEQNAKYQNFIEPIRDLDCRTYDLIKKQSDV